MIIITLRKLQIIRIALIHTIEKPSIGNARSGYMKMGSKEWRWEETFEASDSEELIKYVILVQRKKF